MQKHKDRATIQTIDARKARLNDAALLEIFMAERRQALAEGFSAVEANLRGHGAISKHQRSSAVSD